MALLPSFIVLKSGERYLSLTTKIPENLPSGFLKFDEEQIWSPRVKFAVEPSQTTGLVHIRSCYNNKYLVTKQIEENSWIVASAKKPEEDQSKTSCTLFEPYSLAKLEETTTVRLRHVQTRTSATHSLSADGDTQLGVLASASSTTGSDFSVIDWNRLVILPTQVAFRSEDLDGNYLCSVTLDKWWPYQKFLAGKDVGDPLVAKELVPTSDGNYRIFDKHFGKFWLSVDPRWIRADAESNNFSKETLFSFVKVSDTVIGLKNLGANQYCGHISMDYKDDVLRAEYPSLSRQTRLMVEECIISREITNINYRLSDGRIYDEEIQEVFHAFAVNDSPSETATMSLSYSESDSRTFSWNNSVSIKVGVAVEFTAKIPLIVSGKLQLSAEVAYAHTWGGSETKVYTREDASSAQVQPLSAKKLTLMCTRGACDVPFSYTQIDLLTTGERVTTQKDDGIFTGINSYSFHTAVSDVKKDTQGKIYI